MLLLALASAFGNPHSAFEYANFFMDATTSAYLSLIHNSRHRSCALKVNMQV
jgi:hypothetical protein